MRSASFSTVLLLAVITILIYSCDKKSSNSTLTKTETPVAGTGGLNTFNIIPIHDSIAIDSCMIYIKYNTTVTPVAYDDSFKCKLVDGQPTATFTMLKPGVYYVFGKGWDIIRSQTVVGSQPYTIKTDSAVNTITLDMRKL